MQILNNYNITKNDTISASESFSFRNSPLIKVALGRIGIIFYHKWETQTGGNRKCCKLKEVDCQKFSIQEKFQNKPEKVDFFKNISGTGGNPRIHYEFLFDFFFNITMNSFLILEIL